MNFWAIPGFSIWTTTAPFRNVASTRIDATHAVSLLQDKAIYLWTKWTIASQWQRWWASMIFMTEELIHVTVCCLTRHMFSRDTKLRSLFIECSCSFPFVGAFTAWWNTGSLFLDKRSVTHVDSPPSTNLLYWSLKMRVFHFPYCSANSIHDI